MKLSTCFLKKQKHSRPVYVFCVCFISGRLRNTKIDLEEKKSYNNRQDQTVYCQDNSKHLRFCCFRWLTLFDLLYKWSNVTGIYNGTQPNRIDDVIFRLLTLSVVDCGYKPQLQLVFAASLLSAHHLGKRAKTFWLRIRIMCRSGVTCLPAETVVSMS